MDIDDARAFLTQRGVPFSEREVPYGLQLRCQTGEVVCWYDSGKVVVQGKATDLRRELEEWAEAGGGGSPLALAVAEGEGGPVPIGLNRQVFVVYGHDLQARKDLELLLHKMGMKPVSLANLTPGGDTIIEKLERALIDNAQVKFACVLLTPDDQGYKAGDSEAVQYRARQNVILELGMVLGHLGRRRVAIFYKETVELPSDINSVIYIPFKERVDEQANMLFRVLSEAGYNPDRDAL